jgi:hypothetical protein
MRRIALGLFAALACASGCGPLANDGSADSGGGAGGDATTPPPPSDDGGNPVVSNDAGKNGGHDGSASEAGGPVDGGAGDSAPSDSGPQVDSAQPACTRVTTWVSGAGISNTGWTATASATAPTDGTLTDSVTANAFDNNLGTRWSIGQAQSPTPTEQFTLNLGSAQSMSQIVFFDAADGGGTDFPAAYSLALSSDNATYTTVATGVGAQPTAICFPTQSAQYVQLTQTGTSTSWLSVYEIQVFP